MIFAVVVQVLKVSDKHCAVIKHFKTCFDNPRFGSVLV